MITDAHGNLLEDDAEALVNTVNTVGVMGKGIALQFKRRFPAMFKAYARAAKQDQVELGKVHVWETGMLEPPRYVINFPTKGHWRSGSKLPDIEAGLVDLRKVVQELGIGSIAVPPLGCGNGGLGWREVEPAIRSALGSLEGVDVRVYPPEGAPHASSMVGTTPKPPLTRGKAALLGLLRRYEARALEVSPNEIQSLLYFVQLAGEEMRLDFVKGRYGPYAEAAQASLRAMEGHFVTGFGDGTRTLQSADPITLLPAAVAEAQVTLEGLPETQVRIDRVLELARGFESPYGMELLGTLHWVCIHEAPSLAFDPAQVTAFIASRTDRKARMFTQEHVTRALNHLHEGRWLTP